jgi:hypothetical protein
MGAATAHAALVALVLAAAAAAAAAQTGLVLGDYVSPRSFGAFTDGVDVYHVEQEDGVPEALCGGRDSQVLRRHDVRTGKVAWQVCLEVTFGHVGAQGGDVVVAGTLRGAQGNLSPDVALERFRRADGGKVGGTEVVAGGAPGDAASPLVILAVDAGEAVGIRSSVRAGGGAVETVFETVPGRVEFKPEVDMPGLLDTVEDIGGGLLVAVSGSDGTGRSLVVIDTRSKVTAVTKIVPLAGLPAAGAGDVAGYVNFTLRRRGAFLYLAVTAQSRQFGPSGSLYVQKVDVKTLATLWTSNVLVTRDTGDASDRSARRLDLDGIAHADGSEIDLVAVALGVFLDRDGRPQEKFTVWGPGQGVTFSGAKSGPSTAVLAGLNATDGTLMTAYLPETAGGDTVFLSGGVFVTEDGTIAIAGQFDIVGDPAAGAAVRSVVSWPGIWAASGRPVGTPEAVEETPEAVEGTPEPGAHGSPPPVEPCGPRYAACTAAGGCCDGADECVLNDERGRYDSCVAGADCGNLYGPVCLAKGAHGTPPPAPLPRGDGCEH